MQAYTLYELNEYIKRVIALNFDEPIWIQAEISQYKEVRGQSYLELVDQDENDFTIKAKSSAIIWYKTLLFIKKKLGELTNVILQEGARVMLKVSVEFNEKYGLKLIVEDIDATYSVGQMELARQKIIERIKKDGILDLNKQKKMPPVIQNIAVISSSKAAGYVDFEKQLKTNNLNYTFNLKLFQAAMQGQNVEREVVAAIRKINQESEFDCVVIIRGGGSRLDLSYFDNYNIAHAIAKSEIPIITGIGHDIDESIADLLAHTALKTPTAVADFIIDRNLTYESRLNENLRVIVQTVKHKINRSKLDLQYLHAKMQAAPKEILNKYKIESSALNLRLEQVIENKLIKERSRLERMQSFLELSDPNIILKRGFVMVKKEEKIITDGTLLQKMDEVVLHFYKTNHKAQIK